MLCFAWSSAPATDTYEYADRQLLYDNGRCAARILAAALLGGALSVSGFLLQTFFANPIAGPYILGISSGAKLVVACTMVFALTHGMMVHSVVMIIAAFAGSIAVTGVILLISDKVRSMSILIVCGVMVGYICSAVTEFLVTFADDSNIVNLTGRWEAFRQ